MGWGGGWSPSWLGYLALTAHSGGAEGRRGRGWKEVVREGMPSAEGTYQLKSERVESLRSSSRSKRSWSSDRVRWINFLGYLSTCPKTPLAAASEFIQFFFNDGNIQWLALFNQLLPWAMICSILLWFSEISCWKALSCFILA